MAPFKSPKSRKNPLEPRRFQRAALNQGVAIWTEIELPLRSRGRLTLSFPPCSSPRAAIWP